MLVVTGRVSGHITNWSYAGPVVIRRISAYLTAITDFMTVTDFND